MAATPEMIDNYESYPYFSCAASWETLAPHSIIQPVYTVPGTWIYVFQQKKKFNIQGTSASLPEKTNRVNIPSKDFQN